MNYFKTTYEKSLRVVVAAMFPPSLPPSNQEQTPNPTYGIIDANNDPINQNSPTLLKRYTPLDPPKSRFFNENLNITDVLKDLQTSEQLKFAIDELVEAIHIIKRHIDVLDRLLNEDYHNSGASAYRFEHRKSTHN